MEQKVSYNYKLILKNLVQYLPAKCIVILNSFLILPILTYFLNVKEISVYVVALQMLNIFCTCSSDWISKAVLRFYEKYSLNDKKKIFVSTIFCLSVITYLLAVLILFLFREDFANHFAVNTVVLFLVGILLIPCAIRQNIYQVLRIQNNYNLYTLSIIIYQLIFIVLFIALSGLFPNVVGILLAMITAIMIINIYMLKTFKISYKVEFKFEKSISREVLMYGIPLVITNILYWFVLQGPNLIFQSQERYVETSIMGLSSTIATNIIDPIAGLFLFVNFPVLVKLFEQNKNVKLFFTNVVQLFLYITFPILLSFFFYSTEIVTILLPDVYKMVSIVLPFFALKLFLHNTLKLINIKYHLGNQTYIETLSCASIMLISVLATLYFIGKYSIQIAIIIMLISEVLLLLVNCFIKLKGADYINYAKVLKTMFILILICFGCYFVLDNLFNVDNTIFILIKMAVYFVISYLIGYFFRKNILT